MGPQVPQSVILSNQGPYQTPVTAAPRSPFHPIFTFLDDQPPKSVMLISFGSVFYPTQLWQVEAMYRTLLETRTPFIASKMSATFKPLSPDLEDAIKKSGIGMIVDFVPQRDVLGHPSIGSFLTHGGANSLWESIFAGVLNVFWPIMGDQPDYAAYMSQVVGHYLQMFQWTLTCTCESGVVGCCFLSSIAGGSLYKSGRAREHNLHSEVVRWKVLQMLSPPS